MNKLYPQDVINAYIIHSYPARIDYAYNVILLYTIRRALGRSILYGRKFIQIYGKVKYGDTFLKYI